MLPAYNEEEALGVLLRRIDQTMADHATDYEVVVVDDGSVDRTVAVVQEHAQHMPIRLERHETNQGLGPTIRDGLRVASSLCGDEDIVVTMDADNTHPPGLIHRMASVIEEGADVVIASRYQPGAQVLGVPLHRRLLSSGAYLLFRLVLPMRGVRDYTCGFRAYRGGLLRQAFEQMGEHFISEPGFQCMVDILLKLRRLEPIVREVPLILRYDLKGGVSKMKLGRTVFSTLRLMLRRRFGL